MSVVVLSMRVRDIVVRHNRFEGNFTDYEESKKARLGDITPHRPRVKHILG